MNKFLNVIPLGMVVYGIYMLVTYEQGTMDTKWLLNVATCVLGAGGYLVYSYKDTVMSFFSNFKRKRQVKNVEKEQTDYRARDKEVVDYLATRCQDIDNSEDKQEMMAMLHLLNSKLFEVHYNYDAEKYTKVDPSTGLSE